jgi:hypothetical protein
MPASDREVFSYFGRDPDTALEVDYLAFATFSSDKFDWMKKFEENRRRPPTPEEVELWISELPDSRLEDIRASAESTFDAAARAYLEDEIKERVERAIAESISSNVRESNEALRLAVSAHNDATLSRVRGFTSFRESWPTNVAIGVASSFVFALIIIAASLIYHRDPSPLAIVKAVTTEAPVKPVSN